MRAITVGPTINRTARLRDLAHGGQTVLSGTTGDLVADRLPADVWLTDLGSHRLRDLPRPERVAQLCHPDLHNKFPPLRTVNTVVTHNLPLQLTNFVGRNAETTEVRQLLIDDRLVTLTGAGGRRQDAASTAHRQPDGGGVRRRCLVCRPRANHRSRRRAGRRCTSAGPARSTGPFHNGHPDPFRGGPPRTRGIGQL